jgi:hypothetical protein
MKSDRHEMVKVVCVYCGIEFKGRKERVDKGQSKYCSRSCYILAGSPSTPTRRINRLGKKNAGKSWDKRRGAYIAFWKDEITGKRINMCYARWWWETNRGEILNGCRVSYRDGNPRNINPNNIILISSDEFGNRISKRLMGRIISEDTRKKISLAHTGKTYWNGFVGESKYTKWSKKLKIQVKERDNYICRLCKVDLHNSNQSRIHHIDGDKNNPNIDNLILLCNSCHSLIHSKKQIYLEILAFRSKLK